MSDNWSSLGKKFAKYCKVHLIDLRKHGRSPHSDEFSYEVMCGDVLEYMEDNNIINPIILGHSLGGKVAMKFAFTHTDKIEKLIVADMAPRRYDTDFHQNLLSTLYKLHLEDFEKREEIDRVLSEAYKDKGMRLFLLKNLYRNENKEFAWRFNIDVLLEKVSNIQEADFVKGISRLKVVQAKSIMQSIEKFEKNNGKLSEDLEVVREDDLLSKLIETSASKDKPVIVHNSQNQIVGVISQADLLKAVIEGGDGE